MLWSFFYRAVCGMVRLLALRFRLTERKELEIAVLRHAPAERVVGVRGQIPHPRASPALQRPIEFAHPTRSASGALAN